MLIHQILKTRYPLIQAPMAGIQGHAMCVAVSESGGLGSLPCAMLSPETLEAELQQIQQKTNKPYNVNFFCHPEPKPNNEAEASWRKALAPYFQEYGIDPAAIPTGAGRVPFSQQAANTVARFKPPVVSFHFGLPEKALLEQVKSWGACVISSATTVDEAIWLEQHGADLIIAQGLEAGGHRGMFLTDDISNQVGTFALLPQVLQAVRVPVIAAGGIANATGVKAAMGMGAAGVQIGTSYMLAHEASTSNIHRAALKSPQARHTALTRLFTGRPARGVVNRIMRELGPMSDAPPAFPLATAAIAPLRAKAEAQGTGDFSPLWSGQNASGCREAPAAEITLELARGFD